jgi:hypothetical protein
VVQFQGVGEKASAMAYFCLLTLYDGAAGNGVLFSAGHISENFTLLILQ